MYGDTHPHEYRQTLVESYLHQFADQHREESNFLAAPGAAPQPAPPAAAGNALTPPSPIQQRRGSSNSGNNVLRARMACFRFYESSLKEFISCDIFLNSDNGKNREWEDFLIKTFVCLALLFEKYLLKISFGERSLFWILENVVAFVSNFLFRSGEKIRSVFHWLAFLLAS